MIATRRRKGSPYKRNRGSHDAYVCFHTMLAPALFVCRTLGLGKVSYVEANQRYGIIEAVIHLVNRDFVALADLYKRLGFIPQDQVHLPAFVLYTRPIRDDVFRMRLLACNARSASYVGVSSGSVLGFDYALRHSGVNGIMTAPPV